MNVTERNWQLQNDSSTYRSVRFRKNTEETASDLADHLAQASEETSKNSRAAAEQVSDSSASGRIKASAPDDSVGQLAAELARSETKLDVLQVLSKATRALANLKMSYYSCEGKEAKKVAQMIRRMEKLIKRIQKKAKQLGKEEEMEIQQRKAEKKKEIEKAKQIREELRGKRNKRRRDERNYALKELAEDGKQSVNDTLSSLADAGTAMSGVQTGLYDASGSIDLSGISLEGMSVDVSV